MFNEDEFKKFQNAAKKGKKVDVSSASTSKKTTAIKKKPSQKKSSSKKQKSIQKSVPVEQVGELEDAFAKEFGVSKEATKSAQKDDVIQHNAEKTTNKKASKQTSKQNKQNQKKSKQEQPKKNTNELFSQDTFEQILEGDEIPDQPKSTSKANNREQNFKIKNELKELQKQNDVLLRLLEDERKTTGFLRTVNLELEEHNRELKKLSGETAQKTTISEGSENKEQDETSTETDNNEDTQNSTPSEEPSNDIQEALAQIFQLKQENTRLENEVSGQQETIQKLQGEEERFNKERQELQGKLDALLKKQQAQPSTQENCNVNIDPPKQLAKILHSNGCRDMGEQMQLIGQLGSSQHLIDWFRKIYIAEPQKFEQLLQQKMFCVRDGIDVPLHDALIIRTTNKNCELSEGEELDVYVREFQNGFLINGFRNGHIIGASEKIIPVAQSLLVHHALQIVWNNRFIPTLRRQIFVFWRQEKADRPDFISDEVLELFTEQQRNQFWNENIVQVREALYLTVHATNLALFFRRAAKKINDWQPS